MSKRYTVAKMGGKSVVVALKEHDCLVAIVAINVASTRGLEETDSTFEMSRRDYFANLQFHNCSDKRCGKGAK